MRTFYSSVLAVAVTFVALLPAPAHAGWGVDGATIRSTTATIPQVAACSDGAYGTLVAWQEEASPGQAVLRVQHVLPTGDVDPAWPADGAVACSGATTRTRLAAMSDGLGGLYLSWAEGQTLFIHHLDANGNVAAGWLDGGMALGNGYTDSPYLSLIDDGAHGLYAAWADVSTPRSRATLMHFAPNGDILAGGPISPSNTLLNAYSPRVALAPNGGVFVAWGSYSANPAVVPSDWRIRRLEADGSNASGWPLNGIAMGSFNRAQIQGTAKSGLLGLSPDGRGGVFMLTGNPNPDNSLDARLYRLVGSGPGASDWPSAGVQVWPTGVLGYQDNGDDASFQILPDGRDGAFAGVPSYFDHGADFQFLRVLPTGTVQCCSGGVTSALAQHEFAAAPAGGVWLASFHGTGPYQYYDPYAYLAVDQSEPSAWNGYYEYHDQILMHWFDDIGLTSTSDGGSVLFWSQAHDRFGLFARRFTAAGEVTAVAPVSDARIAIHSIRFAHGAGVRARVTLPGTGPATLGLFDVAGRRRASLDLNGRTGTLDLAIPGTESLTSGIYFARLTAGPQVARGRVCVLR